MSSLVAPNEREWQHVVTQYAAMKGWAWWHFADSRRATKDGRLVGDKGAAGFPDLTLAHSLHGLAFVELKGPSGRLRDAQRRTLDALAGAVLSGVSRTVVHVWRPADWDDVVRPVLDGVWMGARFYGW